MDTSAFLRYLKSAPSYRDQIIHWEQIPGREARYASLRSSLAPPIHTALKALGLLPLYEHQAEAIDIALSGRNVVIATPAASGKTLCYNVPVLNTIAERKNSRALYLFPVKALAQDQLKTLNEMAAAADLNIWAATFDGDTPQSQRAEIRRSAQIIISNPDMLHLGILPNHRSWASFLSQLKYVVIDEVHVYRGVFGSHVAGIMRRLRRLAAHYGARPQFLCCSATIANPREHAENLIGLPFEVITKDGSSFGGKDFICWNPPIVDLAQSVRRSAGAEATHLFTELVAAGTRTIAFARTRRLVELIYRYVSEELKKRAPEMEDLVRPYRGGYLAEDRREIERGLFSGKLLGVIATNALELGVDIGRLDASILIGYPGSISATWQQAGRSGRRGERSLSILIGSENPLDQFIMRHPEALFGRSFEHALISLSNPHILKPHLLCAAWEWPLSPSEAEYFGDCSAVLEELEKAGMLRRQRKRWFPAAGIAYPAREINIRSSSSENFCLVEADTGRILESIGADTALLEMYPGAIYLHQGDTYLITELDFASRIGLCIPIEAHYYTQPMEISDLSIIKIAAEKSVGRIKVSLGEVEVTTQVIGFQKKRIFTEEVIGVEPLDLPPRSFKTTALWFDLPPQIEKTLVRKELDFAGGLHGVEHAAIAMLPLFALCDRNDIGGLSTPLHPNTGKAQIFIYDAHPGGVGIAEKGFELIIDLWDRTLKLIAECPCEEGCPSCIQSPKCGNNNQPLDKAAARVILERLLRSRS